MKSGAQRRLLFFLLSLMAVPLLAVSCSGLSIKIGTNAEEPLKEYTLEGKGKGKVLVIPVKGFLSDVAEKGLLSDHPSAVQEVVSQLRLARKNPDIKALLLEINSPGGSTTGADMLYHEIMEFKELTHVPIVAALMDVAASGGYYVALAADRIVAHPTTVTGSIGVVLVRPMVVGLMDKIGVAVEVTKSGLDKDIGSPFRPSTPEERKIFQDLIDRLAMRFFDLVAKHRKLDPDSLAAVSSARIYLSEDALRLGLVDRIGYLTDALSEARSLAGLPDDAKAVIYRRTKYPNDNLYNTSTSWNAPSGLSLVDLGLRELVPTLSPGFYYLWMPGLADK
jgi:protease-4